MARFYGTLDGDNSSTNPSRLGRRYLGVAARSWGGSIIVNMYTTQKELPLQGRQRVRRYEDIDSVRIRVAMGSTNTGGGGFTLYDGPIAALLDRDARTTLFRALAADVLSDGDSERAIAA
jgi:hypothetical protein